MFILPINYDKETSKFQLFIKIIKYIFNINITSIQQQLYKI